MSCNLSNSLDHVLWAIVSCNKKKTIKILLSKFVGWTRNRGKFNRKENEKKEQSERNWRLKPIGHPLILELLNLEAIKQCVLILIRKVWKKLNPSLRKT